MSRRRHANALLEGWKGPLYPDAVDRLLDVCLRKPGLHSGGLQRIFGQPSGAFLVGYYVQTTDGYGWHGLEFKVGIFGRVLVALPRWQDRPGVNESADRAPAVFYQRVDPSKVSRIVERVIWLISEYKE